MKETHLPPWLLSWLLRKLKFLISIVDFVSPPPNVSSQVKPVDANSNTSEQQVVGSNFKGILKAFFCKELRKIIPVSNKLDIFVNSRFISAIMNIWSNQLHKKANNNLECSFHRAKQFVLPSWYDLVEKRPNDSETAPAGRHTWLST